MKKVHSKATEERQGQTVGLAVIGSGYWGKNLARNFYQIGALKLICDKNEEVLSNFMSQYQNVATCFAISDVLARPDIGAVVIATPAERVRSKGRTGAHQLYLLAPTQPGQNPPGGEHPVVLRPA